MKKKVHEIRSLLYIGFLIIAIIGIHLITVFIIDSTCDVMYQYVDEIEAAIKGNSSAAELARDMNDYWQTRRNIWELVTRHSEVEEIDVAIHRLIALLDQNSSGTADEALPELSELRFALEHVAGAQHLTLVNIL